jgi:hypothetical protein
MEDILGTQFGIDTGRGVRGELRQCFHIPLFFNAPQVEAVHVPSWVDAYRARGVSSTSLLCQLGTTDPVLQAPSASLRPHPGSPVWNSVKPLVVEAVRVQQPVLDPGSEGSASRVHHEAVIPSWIIGAGIAVCDTRPPWEGICPRCMGRLIFYYIFTDLPERGAQT